MIHLHAVDVEPSAKIDVAFFVVERHGKEWSATARVLAVHPTEAEAQQAALGLSLSNPKRQFGVAVLRSEARHVAQPVEIVRAGPPA